jgi:putative tricarboxylic transport membrane protein
VGSYAVGNSMVDVAAMLALGMVGFFMRRHDFPGAPIVIAFILGPLVEKSLRQSLALSQGTWNIFVTSPICISFLVLTVLSVAFSINRSRKRERKEGTVGYQ